MQIGRLIHETLSEISGDLDRSLRDLRPLELDWRPCDEANSIGFILWHQIRVEDAWVNEFARGRSPVFTTDSWDIKWNIPGHHTGFGYTRENIDAFVTPPLSSLKQYGQSVRKETIAYLYGLGCEDFDLQPETDHPWRQGYTVGRMFGHILCELSQHVGHIRYLRGLQRGLNG